MENEKLKAEIERLKSSAIESEAMARMMADERIQEAEMRNFELSKQCESNQKTIETLTQQIQAMSVEKDEAAVREQELMEELEELNESYRNIVINLNHQQTEDKVTQLTVEMDHLKQRISDLDENNNRLSRENKHYRISNEELNTKVARLQNEAQSKEEKMKMVQDKLKQLQQERMVKLPKELLKRMKRVSKEKSTDPDHVEVDIDAIGVHAIPEDAEQSVTEVNDDGDGNDDHFGDGNDSENSSDHKGHRKDPNGSNISHHSNGSLLSATSAISTLSIRSNSVSKSVPKFQDEPEDECNLCDLKDSEIAYLKQDSEQRVVLMEKLETKVEAVLDEKDELENRFNALNAEYDELKVKFDQIQNQMESDRVKQETNFNHLQSQLGEQREQYAVANNELKEMKVNQEEREHKFEEMEIQCEEQQNTIKQLRAKHQHLKQEMVKIRMERELLLRDKEATPSLSAEEEETKECDDTLHSLHNLQSRPPSRPQSTRSAGNERSPRCSPISSISPNSTEHKESPQTLDTLDTGTHRKTHSFESVAESQESTELHQEQDIEIKEWESTQLPNGGHSRSRSDAFLFYPASEVSNGGYSPSFSSMSRASQHRPLNVTLSFDEESIQKLQRLEEDKQSAVASGAVTTAASPALSPPLSTPVSPRDQLKKRLNSKRIKSKAKKYKKRSDRAEAKRKLQARSQAIVRRQTIALGNYFEHHLQVQKQKDEKMEKVFDAMERRERKQSLSKSPLAKSNTLQQPVDHHRMGLSVNTFVKTRSAPDSDELIPKSHSLPQQAKLPDGARQSLTTRQAVGSAPDPGKTTLNQVLVPFPFFHQVFIYFYWKQSKCQIGRVKSYPMRRKCYLSTYEYGLCILSKLNDDIFRMQWSESHI